MLQRDIRRQMRRAAAEKAMRREWHEKNEKWSACPNHGPADSTQDRYSLLVETSRVGIGASEHVERKLLCLLCKSTWLTTNDFTHP